MNHNWDLEQLDNLLKVTPEMDIYAVVGRMTELVQLLQETRTALGILPFLETYLMVTKSVAASRIDDHYPLQDKVEIENLDNTFAQHFFTPLHSYLISKSKITPWQRFFDYVERRDALPFVQVLLGINAHINGDLASSLYRAEVKQRADFLQINTVLLELIPFVMRNLAYKHRDPVGWGAMILTDFIEEEFQKVVVQWREAAWRNYMNMTAENFDRLTGSIHQQTEEIAEELIRCFHDRRFGNLIQLIDTLNQLTVDVS